MKNKKQGVDGTRGFWGLLTAVGKTLRVNSGQEIRCCERKPDSRPLPGAGSCPCAWRCVQSCRGAPPPHGRGRRSSTRSVTCPRADSWPGPEPGLPDGGLARSYGLHVQEGQRCATVTVTPPGHSSRSLTEEALKKPHLPVPLLCGTQLGTWRAQELEKGLCQRVPEDLQEGGETATFGGTGDSHRSDAGPGLDWLHALGPGSRSRSPRTGKEPRASHRKAA